MVSSFPITDFARGKLNELFNTENKLVNIPSMPAVSQNASAQATTDTAADSASTQSISSNTLSIPEKLLSLSRQEDNTAFKAECSKLGSSDLECVWNPDLIKAMKPHCSPELQTEIEKIIQSAKLKQIDPSDAGIVQLWNYIVSKYNQNQFFVKDMLTQDNLQPIYNLHMLSMNSIFFNLRRNIIPNQNELAQRAAHSAILDTIFTTAQRPISEKLQEFFST